IVQRLRLQLRNFALGVMDVAEDDSAGWTRGLTRSYHVAVAHRAILKLRGDLTGPDALHAIGALLHDAAAAHADFGIAQRAQALGREVRVLQKVEAADLVRTVVRAIARADAAVVDHVVQAVAAVDGGGDGTNQLTRRIFAVHARHRLKEERWMGGVPL